MSAVANNGSQMMELDGLTALENVRTLMTTYTPRRPRMRLVALPKVNNCDYYDATRPEYSYLAAKDQYYRVDVNGEDCTASSSIAPNTFARLADDVMGEYADPTPESLKSYLSGIHNVPNCLGLLPPLANIRKPIRKDTSVQPSHESTALRRVPHREPVRQNSLHLDIVNCRPGYTARRQDTMVAFAAPLSPIPAC